MRDVKVQGRLKPEDDERGTPQALFDQLNAEFRFTLDAAASHLNAKVPHCYYTSEGPAAHGRLLYGVAANATGLSGPWVDERVWCNPPFSALAEWVEKAWRSQAELVVMLLPACRTDQAWWHEWVEPARDDPSKVASGMRLRTRFLKGRPRFTTPDGVTMGSPKFGCVILIWERA